MDDNAVREEGWPTRNEQGQYKTRLAGDTHINTTSTPSLTTPK